MVREAKIAVFGGGGGNTQNTWMLPVDITEDFWVLKTRMLFYITLLNQINTTENSLQRGFYHTVVPEKEKKQ
jgi:hypothetical protein